MLTQMSSMPARLNGETRLFPIIGDPIIYARSPERLSRGFAARGHSGLCVPMQVPEGTLEPVMRGLALIPNIDGLLVTTPHKFAAHAYCATSAERSRPLQVVSVIRRNHARKFSPGNSLRSRKGAPSCIGMTPKSEPSNRRAPMRRNCCCGESSLGTA
jgi:hypothetical protein